MVPRGAYDGRTMWNPSRDRFNPGVRTRRARSAALAAAIALCLPLGSRAQSSGPGPRLPKVLSEAEESARALEALPQELRADAGLWLLTAQGFKERRATKNGYTCIVNRDEVEAIKPTCYDAEGTRTILPAVVRFGDLLMKGMPVAEIKKDIAEGFRTGRFTPPKRAGIAFMLSPRIVNVLDAAKGTFGTAPPHYMIYAPNVTNADLSIPDAAYDAHPWLPYVAYTGPHGFIIVTVPETAGASTQ